MDPLSGITRWFKQLAFGRVNAVKGRARGKVMGAQARAKSKAANKFNKGVDGAAKGAKNKALGKKGAKAKKKPSESAASSSDSNQRSSSSNQRSSSTNQKSSQKQQGQKMGIFKKKSGSGDYDERNDVLVSEDKTQMVDVDAFDQLTRECVGWIVIWNGPQKGRDFRLEAGKNPVGTDANCTVVISDPYASGQHCVVRFEEGEYVLVDLDSTNGTYVNRERVVKHHLIDNDTIRIGRTELRFKALY